MINSIATAKNDAMKYQIDTYSAFSLRIPTSPAILTPQNTQKITITRSRGHSNSEYSFDWLTPKNRLTTANKIAKK